MANVPTITSLGDDALTNQYEITIDDAPINQLDNITLRMDQSFEIPQKIYNEYDINIRGHHYVKLGRLEETDKHLTVDVRIDQEWLVYDALEKWRKMGLDSQTGIGSSDADVRGTAHVSLLGADNSIKKKFVINGIRPKAITVTALDQNSGDPIRMSVEFVYDWIDDGVTV